MSKSIAAEQENHTDVTIRSYVVGFVSSIVLTLAAYLLTEAYIKRGALSHRLVVGSIAVLAVIQFVVQLVCFLHLGRERKPRWKAVVFWSMLLVVGILVAGSLWIMHSLNYRMTTQQMQQYMNNQDGL